MLWLADLVLAQAQMPSTGNGTIDTVLSGMALLLGGSGGTIAVLRWLASRKPAGPDAPEAASLAVLADRQEMAAKELAKVTEHVERIDGYLRDAQIRLARLEGMGGI